MEGLNRLAPSLASRRAVSGILLVAAIAAAPACAGVIGADFGDYKVATCSDGIQDGDETGVDCGGSCPIGCGTGQACKTVADCQDGPNGTVTCFQNVCGFTCTPGYADCDGSVGCEADITQAAHCGSCTNACGSVCSNGTCNDPTQLAGGYLHFCALLQDGSVYCWGFNEGGEVGDGTKTIRTKPVKVTLKTLAIQLAAGGLYWLPYDSVHSCALLSNHSVACWGSNHFGELGQGDTIAHTGPVAIPALGSEIAQISGHGAHVCAVDDAGNLFCWGFNDAGQVGIGSNSLLVVASPTQVISGGVSTVSAGGHHTCVIKTDKKLYCWGWNAYGQLGDGTTSSTFSPGAPVPGLFGDVLEVAATRRSTCAHTTVGVYCWGWNGGGEVGNGSLLDQWSPVLVPKLGSLDVTQIAMGQDQVAALTTSGLFMWGTDVHGELGNGKTMGDVPSPEIVTSVPALSSIALSYTTSCGLTKTGQVLCWGENTYGEAGNGTLNNNALTPTPVAWP
jgi:alpha-tubulin suppressor-like RCC1 family protein